MNRGWWYSAHLIFCLIGAAMWWRFGTILPLLSMIVICAMSIMRADYIWLEEQYWLMRWRLGLDRKRKQ